MTLKTTLIAIALGGIAAAGVAGAASAQPYPHPRQHEVLQRVQNQRAEIRDELYGHRMAPAKAHRLLAADNRIARREHRMFAANGGYLTKAQHHRLNHQENRLERRIRG